MKSSAKKIKMASYDSLFEIEKTIFDETSEKIQHIPLLDLFPFKNHPFQVLDDDKMKETKESIEKYGVLVPIIIRPRSNGGYELVAGHRRKRACELLELKTIPAIIRTLDDEESTIIMVDSNIQRENLLYSEKSFAYKMKLEAIKKQGKRTDLTCDQVEHKLKARDIVAKESGESGIQVSRYIRLTELTSDLLHMVDNKKLAFNTAVELSYLSHDEQKILLNTIINSSAIPSMSQANKLKRYSTNGTLSKPMVEEILLSVNDKPLQIILKSNQLAKYFTNTVSSQEIEDTIIQLLEQWYNTK